MKVQISLNQIDEYCFFVMVPHIQVPAASAPLRARRRHFAADPGPAVRTPAPATPAGVPRRHAGRWMGNRATVAHFSNKGKETDTFLLYNFVTRSL